MSKPSFLDWIIWKIKKMWGVSPLIIRAALWTIFLEIVFAIERSVFDSNKLILSKTLVAITIVYCIFSGFTRLWQSYQRDLGRNQNYD